MSGTVLYSLEKLLQQFWTLVLIRFLGLSPLRSDKFFGVFETTSNVVVCGNKGSC